MQNFVIGKILNGKRIKLKNNHNKHRQFWIHPIFIYRMAAVHDFAISVKTDTKSV